MTDENNDKVNWPKVYSLLVGFLILQLIICTWITLSY
jgi:hypothetical protein